MTELPTAELRDGRIVVLIDDHEVELDQHAALHLARKLTDCALEQRRQEAERCRI